MEARTTSKFAALRRAYEEAYAAFENDCDVDALDDPLHKSLSENSYQTLDGFMIGRAETAEAVAEKLKIIDERDMTLWESWPQYRDAIQRDILDLQRPTATIDVPFESWRSAWQAHVTCDGSDEEADLLCLADGAAFRALLSAPCASPGDFMVKAYASLLEELGCTHHVGRTGSLWDVDIERADHPTHSSDEWQRSAYRDLDMSDLGACLLAFGRLDFSAEEWASRAAAVDLHIQVIEDCEGDAPALIIGMYDHGCGQRLRRERNRLRRMLVFNPARQEAVGAELLKRRQQYTAPSFSETPHDKQTNRGPHVYCRRP